MSEASRRASGARSDAPNTIERGSAPAFMFCTRNGITTIIIVVANTATIVG